MLKITDGKDVLVVSSGAYRSQYKPFGWNIVNDPVHREVEKVAVDNVELPRAEKPLSEMNSKELKAKARELGVDISGASSKGEARKMLADVIN